MEPVPKHLDWVTVRAGCSIEQLFLLLAEVIASDVKAATACRQDAQFTLNRLADTKFAVAVSRNSGGILWGDSVIFERSAAGITAKAGRTDTQLFLAKPSFTGHGDCKLEINGEPLELWQVSRKALEDLFFST